MTEATVKTPVTTATSLAESAMAKLRAADAAAQKQRKKEAKPDSGFSPQAAGFSAQQWAALSPTARLYAINSYIEQRRAAAKKAKAKEAESATS